MEVRSISSPFGGRTRTRVLVALRLIRQSYPRELSRVLKAPLSVVQKALRSLELDGLVAGRTAGSTRLYELNPGYFARQELAALLLRLADADADLRRDVARLRRRPRRHGKPL